MTAPMRIAQKQPRRDAERLDPPIAAPPVRFALDRDMDRHPGMRFRKSNVEILQEGLFLRHCPPCSGS